MDCEGLGRREAALRVHLEHLIDQRHRLVGEACAGIGELLARGAEAGADGIVPFGRQKTLRHAEAQASNWRGLQGCVLLARDHSVAARAVRDVARQRADRVEREGKRKRSIGRHALLARLVADDPAERRWNAARPPVSVPIAISHMWSATVTAAPDDEPPGTRLRSAGLPGVP